MKTSELTGVALDWAVAKCEGKIYGVRGTRYEFQPSTHWAQGGPIIEREKIKIYALHESPDLWAAQLSNANWESGPVFCHHGPTPLVAAMRCYVASKLGDTVEIPEELKP